MKVLHLGKFYPPATGGMETVLQMLCERTPEIVENHALVAGAALTTSSEQGRVQVTRAGVVARFGAVSWSPSMPLLVRRERPDLVVIHEPNPMGLLAYALARPPCPLIVWFHSEVIRPDWRYRTFYQPLLQLACSRASAIVVASPTLAASSPQLAGWRSKCVVIPYGVDTPAEVVVASSRRERPMVLFVGRLVAYKGADVLIDASREIDADVVIVGDGPRRAALEHQIVSCGLGHRVRMTGTVSDGALDELYRACDVFVLPSVTRQEAFGIVQLEAMARGKPVISTELGTGTSWVNRHGETGLVVPPRDPGALAGALRELLGDSARRSAMGEAASRRARSTFRADRMIEATVDLYRSVLERPLKDVA